MSQVSQALMARGKQTPRLDLRRQDDEWKAIARASHSLKHITFAAWRRNLEASVGLSRTYLRE